MATRGAPTVRPIWAKQAEEAKLKEEEQKAAAARAAFDATFKDVDAAAETLTLAESANSDSETDESEKLANKPIGPVDPSKCTAAGTGVAGGAAGAAASFVIATKDADGRKIPHGGAQIKVKISPGLGVGGVEQEGAVKDHGDGTYTVTYAVPKRGDYMVSVECNGAPILNSPFPVFFSGVNAALPNGVTPPTGLLSGTSLMPNAMQTPFTGLFPGTLGMLPGSTALGQMPLPPSAAAIAAAQSIMAVQAYQAAQAAQARAAAQDASASKEDSGSLDEKRKDALRRTLQVSNLSPMLNTEQLTKFFGFCGTVTGVHLAESKQLAYIEYSKPEEAQEALKMNNWDVQGRPINVEMAKSLPEKKPAILPSPTTNGLLPSALPAVMQQAVVLQQYHFQQALLRQQAVASHNAAIQAATLKSASEMAVARAAEISKSLKVDGNDQEDKETKDKSSPSRSRRSRSHSPIRYRRDRRSRSRSRSPLRYRRDRRSRSRSRERHRYIDNRDRSRFYRSREDYYRSHLRHYREHDREKDYERRSSRRSKSPSRTKRRRSGSRSPRSHRELNRSPSKLKNEEHPRNTQSDNLRPHDKEGTEAVERKSEKDRTAASKVTDDERKNAEAVIHADDKAATSARLFEQELITSSEKAIEAPKAPNDQDHSEDERKEKKKAKRHHRREDDHEKHDKKKKKHKHRHGRSPSVSGDGLPATEHCKSKGNSDDATRLKKRHKKKSRRSSKSASLSSSASD